MKRCIILFSFGLLFAYTGNGQETNQDINWPQCMGQQDLLWDTINSNYYAGMILGNGLMGANIYKENEHAVRFDIGRSDVTDQRPHDSLFTESLITHARLPIGRMTLVTKGRITGARMKLDLYNAEAVGTIFTSEGKITFKSIVPAEEDVVYIEATGSNGEKGFLWKWIGEKSISPRFQFYKTTYKPNPPFQLSHSHGYNICYQPLLYKGEYATVWRELKQGDKQIVIINTSYSPDKKDVAIKEATASVQKLVKRGLGPIFFQHRNWWHHYFQQSFISIPDRKLASFYWMQLYKLASATRRDKPMMDLMGPWFTSQTPWPGVWWNMNTQLAYSPIFTSNHLELGKSLYDAINRNIENLVKNVPSEWQYNSAGIGRLSSYDLVSPLTGNLHDGSFEPGNFTWALYYYYQYYAYSQDINELRTKIFPLLKLSVNYLIHLLSKDENGIYHLSESYSPEYKYATDANYTLSCLSWGLHTLLHADSICNFHDPESGKWKRILSNLVPFPVDSSGFMIGKDVALTTSHRHFSHLMMIYPFHLVNPDVMENRSLIELSIHHWLSMKSGLAGFSYPVAASMYALLGKGDTTLYYLNKLLEHYPKTNNTLYRESGPVIETSLAAATSIQEMLLQNWGGKIRVFPAIPSRWQDVCFADLRAEGAFLISAKRKRGVTEFISVKSLKGGPCSLQSSLDDLQVKSDQRENVSFKLYHGPRKGESVVQFNTQPGETVVLYRKKGLLSRKYP